MSINWNFEDYPFQGPIPGASLPIFPVSAFGATGDGVTDDTAAIQRAITALTNAGGGTLFFAYGTYCISSTLNFGNGTSSVASTISAFQILGGGSGGFQDTTVGTHTEIKWIGVLGGTMAQFNGAMHAVKCQGVLFNGNQRAAIGLVELNVSNGLFVDTYVADCSQINWWRMGTANAVGGALGPSNMVYINCGVTISAGFNGASSSAPIIGLCLGGEVGQPYVYNSAAGTVQGAYLGHYNAFRVNMYDSNNSVGIDLRYVDHNYFYGGFVVAQYAVRCSPNPNFNGFPAGNRFYSADWQGNSHTPGGTSGGLINTNGTFVPVASSDLNYVELLDLGQTYPGSITGGEAYWPTFTWLYGVTGTGIRFGAPGSWSRDPIQFLDRATNTLSNFTTLQQLNATSYTVYAGRLNVLAAVLKVRATGTYSTTLTPTFQLQIRLGSTVLLDTGAITCSSTNQPWFLEYEGVIRTAGSTGSQISSVKSEAGFLTNSSGAKFMVGPYGASNIDFTSDQAVSIWAACSAASASNSITVQAWEVEILYTPLDGTV